MQISWAHVLGCDVKKNSYRSPSLLPQTLRWLLLAFQIRINILNKSFPAWPKPAPPCFQADLGLLSPHDSWCSGHISFFSCFVYFLQFAKSFSTRDLVREFVPLPEKSFSSPFAWPPHPKSSVLTEVGILHGNIPHYFISYYSVFPPSPCIYLFF